MNVLVLVAVPDQAAGMVAAWRAALAPDDRVFALSLAGPIRYRGDADLVHALQLDTARAPRAPRRLYQALSLRHPRLAARLWRIIAPLAAPDVAWTVRSFDPDVVDVRGVPGPGALARRLRGALANAVVIADGPTRRPVVDLAWRRRRAAATVSIVLPVYNGGRFLRRSIESCLAQTHPSLELIVVDDASTDETPAVIREYAARDRRVVAVRNPTNLRLPGALNAGFARARGELLTWTSHDNYYAPEALETLAGYLASDPDVDFVYSAYRGVDEADRVEPEISYRPPPWEIRHANPVGPYFLYRRRVYETTGEFREEMEFMEDYDYWARVFKHYRMMRLPYPLYFYRTHADSMSSRSPDTNELRRHLQALHFPR